MRSFSDDERSRIRQQLRETGRELFTRYGLRKTTLSELTDPAGIATSTFYQFYDSKEELYVELLEEEREEVSERIFAASFGRYDDPERIIEAFVLTVMDEIETNPLVHRIIVNDELDHLQAQFSGEEQAAAQDHAIADFLPLIERWYDEGYVHGPSPEAIAHSMRAAMFLSLHEDDIPMYQTVKETLVAALARGLTSDGETVDVTEAVADLTDAEPTEDDLTDEQ